MATEPVSNDAPVDAPVDQPIVEAPVEETTKDSPTEEVVETNPETALAEEALLEFAGDVKGSVEDNPTLHPEVEEETETLEEVETPVVEEPVTEPAPEPKVEEPVIPKPEVKSDPGDFEPSDYSFEVKTTDGKTVKITAPEDATALAERLDDNPELLAASEYTKFNINTTKMTLGIERERQTYDANKGAYETEKAAIEARNTQLNQWASELDYLRNKGDLPAITDELNKANWQDPKVFDQAPVKEALAIFKWMEGENIERRRAGIPEVTSAVDAFRLMLNENERKEAIEEKSKDKETRQRKGAMVGKNAPYIPSNAPKNTIIGSGGSLSQLGSDLY